MPFSASREDHQHHYAFETSQMVVLCLVRIRETLEQASAPTFSAAVGVLYDLEATLMEVERLIHTHFVHLIEDERESILMDTAEEEEEELDWHGPPPSEEEHTHLAKIPSSLEESIQMLQNVLKLKETQQERSSSTQQQDETRREKYNAGTQGTRYSSSQSSTLRLPERNGQAAGDSSIQQEPAASALLKPARSATDSMLFRLTVALQLCLVRIDDAHFVLVGKTRRESAKSQTWRRCATVVAATSCLGGTIVWCRTRTTSSTPSLSSLVYRSAQTGLGALGLCLARKTAARLWMSNKIINSIAALEEWRQQWVHVQLEDNARYSTTSGNTEHKSERLIKFVMKQNPKTSFWHSEGEIRFLMLKRAMDLLYASVGTAVDFEGQSDIASTTSSGQSAILPKPLTTMAAASFYSIVGAKNRAARAVASPSRDRLIQNAWSMISLPSIKLLSLRATQLLKRAALAERVDIEGLTCFILSRDPCPDVVAALKRYARQEKRRACLRPTLSTIDEDSAHSPRRHFSLARIVSGSCRKRNVIFHLTGGGFFAHTLASDLPYLLDWSAKTGAIVICPEYALLPEHPFPTALNQISDVYEALVSGLASSQLGFQVDRLIISGESAGGNLAAALLVKLCTSRLEDVESVVEDKERQAHSDDTCQVEQDTVDTHESNAVGLPDALMLSCPALNLSLELSPSRVIGHEDPVLPTGLISAISDAYIPPSGNISKQNPLASPFFAPDHVLQHFPPTLLFASSDDPLLDDSVDFNRRLWSLGRDSNLRAVQNLPHAYWGLASAGFPEAKQVQEECIDFLVKHFESEEAYDKA